MHPIHPRHSHKAKKVHLFLCVTINTHLSLCMQSFRQKTNHVSETSLAQHSTAMCCLQLQWGYNQSDMKSLWCRCGSNWDGVQEWQEPLSLQDMGGRRNPGILGCDKLICVVPMEDGWVCVGIHLKHQVIKWYDSLLVSVASTSHVSLCIQCKAGQTCLSINFVLRPPTSLQRPHLLCICMLILSSLSVYANLTSLRLFSMELLQ